MIPIPNSISRFLLLYCNLGILFKSMYSRLLTKPEEFMVEFVVDENVKWAQSDWLTDKDIINLNVQQTFNLWRWNLDLSLF